MPLSGMEIVLAGRLTDHTHKELATELRSRGAQVSKYLRASTSLVIVGTEPGKRAEKAEEMGIQLLYEADLPTFLRLPTQSYHPTASIEERLAELRGLLNRSHNKETWDLICLLFDTWPDDELEVGIAYASQHLQSWDAELLTSPRNWLDDAREGNPNPRMALVRHLHATTKILEFPPHGENPQTQTLDPMLGDTTLITLLTSGCIDQVEHISLPAQNISDTGIKALSTHKGLAQLRTLHLEGNAYSAKCLPTLCDAFFLPQLESLHLQSFHLALEEVKALRREPGLQHIPSLKITPSIAETAWSCLDSDGDRFEYFFHADGHISYLELEHDSIRNQPQDQWRQLGDQVSCTIANGYSTYQGTIQGLKVLGTSSNQADHMWSWEWTFLPNGPTFHGDM